MYKLLIRPILFLFDPEKVHYFIFRFIKQWFRVPGVNLLFKSIYSFNSPALERNLFGLTFKNPVGLAAGFDKEGLLFEELGIMGFGFVEIGTITPEAQAGNPKPRLFRLKTDHAIINRMGFNHGGVRAVVERLRKKSGKVLIGGNIGKNKITPNDLAWQDYEKCFLALNAHVDYFVVNISSPNTPNLRELQDKEPLTKLLEALIDLRSKQSIKKPILLKIAPDLTDSQLDDIVEIVIKVGLDGVVATNTTIDRSGLKSPKEKIEVIGVGGLSGKPLKNRSTEVIRYISKKSKKAFPIIGVGGIMSAEDAVEKLEAGADLVQIYTGFIYEGPALVKRINKLILKKAL